MMEKPTNMQAIFTEPNTHTRLLIRGTPVPIPAANQALIKVGSFSLNQGETRSAMDANTSYIPGWDFAGIVLQAADDGSTPGKGARVFGFIPQGAWAEYIVAPGCLMAEIPNGVSNAQAASLPIAGTTALMALDAAGMLADRKVLVTGAAGGVGRFACQLAASGGAKVFALSRRANLQQQLIQDGVHVAGVFCTMAHAKEAGEYDVILDSVGGDTLTSAILALAPNGICVNYGNSSRQPTTFDVRSAAWPFHRKQCIFMGREVPPNCTPILDRLAGLVKQGRLLTPIDRELPWTQITEAAELLVRHQVNGKIILHVV